MKQVVQLNAQSYFVNVTYADASPLEQDVFIFPAYTVDAEVPLIPEGKTAKWCEGTWVFEDVLQPEPTPEPLELTYVEKRIAEYPPITDYLDGVVKGDQAQIDKYIADCIAVKTKYPKDIL